MLYSGQLVKQQQQQQQPVVVVVVAAAATAESAARSDWNIVAAAGGEGREKAAKQEGQGRGAPSGSQPSTNASPVAFAPAILDATRPKPGPYDSKSPHVTPPQPVSHWQWFQRPSTATHVPCAPHGSPSQLEGSSQFVPPQPPTQLH